MIDPAVAEVVKWTVRALTSFIGKRPRIAEAPAPDIEAVISRNVVEALTWASTLQIFGMTSSADPETNTIPLRLSETPRRFRGVDQGVEQPEAHILESLANILLLGDPGSGKTTTLRRLTKQLVTGKTSEEVPNAIPVIVRFRDLGAGDSLLVAVASKLGLQTEWKHYASTEHSQSKFDKQELWIGQERAKDVIAEFLGENRTLLIFDGLDEFPGDPIAARKDLNWLALMAQQSQVIVSCRSGDYNGQLEGYTILELCPLTIPEVDKIIELSGVLVADFRSALQTAPYADLVDRPLFLAQLLLIFKRYEYLPKYTSDTYKLIVGLMLREWDAERSIRRHSQYAAFTPDRKLSFLAAISYFLTYRVKLKAFATRDLAQVYSQIHVQFDLPKEEAYAVVAEIESHTGLILVAGFDRYEFSHLSLQEYLAAEYISREAHSLHIQDYLREYPAPIAIALTLTSNSSGFFATLFLRRELPSSQIVRSFLSRLMLERPNFGPSPLFGAAFLRLISEYQYDQGLVQALVEMLELGGAKESLAKAFGVYHRSHTTDDIQSARVSLRCVVRPESAAGLELPDPIRLPVDLYERLLSLADSAPTDYRAAPGRVQAKDRPRTKAKRGQR